MGAIAAAQVVGGYMQSEAARKTASTNKKMFDQVNSQLQSIGLPPLSPVEYQQYSDEMAKLNPDEVYKVAQTAPSATENMTIDRTGRGAQLQALSKLADIGNGGLTVEDQAALEQITAQTDAQNASNQAAIQQNLARRGVAGGGQEMVARQMAAQNAGNVNRMGGLQVAADARKRALEAIMSGGQMGGQLQAADSSEAFARADAKDKINMFNTNLLQGAYGQRGDLAVQKAGNAQAVANNNTGLKNKTLDQPNQFAQQNFDNQLQKVGVQTGVATQRAGANTAATQASNQGIQSATDAIAAGGKFWWDNKDK
jgi:hypothetical protein